MQQDEKKMFLLKMKYSVIDVTKKEGNRKITRKKEKLYLVKNIDSIDEKLTELEDLLLEEHNEHKSNYLKQVQDYLKRFGSLCNKTYFRMLRT